MGLEDGSAAVGGAWKIDVGGAWKIFCLYILKAHGLRSMGLLCCGVFIKRPTQRSGWAWKIDVGGLGRWVSSVLNIISKDFL